MNRPKTRYDHPQHQHPQQHYHPSQHRNYGGAVPQGPPPNVAQNRMPNSAGSAMRAQGMNTRPHVQQQPQQQQQMQGQQVPQQQAHHGGVTIQQHQYQHVQAPGHPQAPTMIFYPAQSHGAPQNFIQISPYTISSNPAMPLHPITQIQTYTPRFTTYAYGAQPGQAQQGYFHGAAAATPAPAHTMYSTTAAVPPQYVHQQHRMSAASMHASSQAVANAQQLQQAPVAPAHVTAITAQHQPQHSHPQQQNVQVGPPPAQPIARQELPQERKRNRLKFVHPTTGEEVQLDEGSTNSAGATSTPNAESGPAKGAASTLESAQNSTSSSSEKPDTQTLQSSVVAQDGKQKDETVTAAKEDGSSTVADRNKCNVRAEFYQKIAQASDDARTGSSTGSSSSAAAAATVSNSASVDSATLAAEPQPTEPTAVAVVSSPTPVPSTPTKEKSPSPEPSKQLVPNTPVANLSSDDSKDASLVSISPTPIENYSTPRRDYIASSPPLQPPIEKFEEEEAIVEAEPEPSAEAVIPAAEETIIPEPEPRAEAIPLVKENHEEEVAAPVQVQEEVPEEPEPLETLKQEELEREEPVDIEDDEVTEEPQNQPNGHLPLEDGEIRDEDDDESTVPESGSDEQGDATETTKGKIKYDRDFLLSIGQKGPVNEFKVADRGLPDLARDSLNNHIKHGMPMTKNSPGPRDYRGMRGMPNPGNKGNLLPQGMQHMRLGGGMTWGVGGLAIPPPPPRGLPPKVLMTIQREEVKLHKAENAWKPNTLKRDPSADKNVDEEKIMVDSIVKKTRGILNKLTPDNFDKLVQTFMELPLEDKDERISSVISVVFEKAIDEPSFSTAYARMVQTVCKTSQETSKKFRKQILDQCQKEFQRGNIDEAEIKDVEQKLAEATDEESRETLKLELEDKKYQSRRRSLGNVRFIGELYKLQMLTPKIMVECVHLLLYAPDEEKLECLCKLLTTVGQRLDIQLRNLEEQVARGDSPKFVPEPKWMDKTFQQLSTLSDDKKLSSRIRFAILDVVELRDNDWKPRRDTNAPKTIEEVRKEAYRQELEEKRQINSLPPVQNNYGGGGDRDHRTGNSRLPGGPQQPKKGDWTTVQNSKTSSRFQTMKKTEPMSQGGMPVLAPPSFGPAWANKAHGPTGPPLKNLPPRLQQQSRFSNLSEEGGGRAPNKGMHNSESGNYRDPQPAFMPHPIVAPPMHHPPVAPSPPPSTNSSATNSRPVSPKDVSESFTADVSESVKNIFQEYHQSKKFDDTLHWIKNRFPGSMIDSFIEELGRQVGEMSKEVEQKCAGMLIRLLIKNREVPKDAVIKLLAQGVMQELPDVLIDSPMATHYLAQFLVEIFSEENNLNWLVLVGESLRTMEEEDEDDGSAWRELSINSLKLLKLRSNEENVQTSFKNTKHKNVIPVEQIPWLLDKTPDKLAEEMVKVLSCKINSESADQLGQIFQEHSWDVREESTARALTEAICTLTWNEAAGSWNDERVKKLLPLLALPNQKIFPAVWKQVEDYSRRKSIDKKKSEGLWNIMFSLNMTTTD